MKIHKLLILFSVCLTFFSACNDESSSPELYVSQTSVTLTALGQSEEILVKGGFSASWIGENWGSVTTSQKGVIINVTQNNTESARYATVRVTNGSENKIVRVSQSGLSAEILFDPASDTIQLKNSNSVDSIIKVVTALKNWTVKGAPSWIRVNAHPASGILSMSIDQNDGQLGRQAILTLESGVTKKELVVIQTGFNFFVMPLLDFGIKPGGRDGYKRVLTEYETAQGRTYIGDGDGGGNTLLTVEYGADRGAFSHIQYNPMARGLNYGTLTIVCQSTVQVINSKDWKNYLKENGYEYRYVETTIQGVTEFYYKGVGTTKTICLNYIESGTVKFTVQAFDPLIPEQQEPYTTFEQLPYNTVPWGSTKDEVKAWEAANGGTNIVAAETDTRLEFQVGPPANNDFRYYWFDNETFKLTENKHRFNNFNLGYYKARATGAYTYKFAFTKEFRTLLLREGFDFVETTDFGDIFYHPKKKMQVLIGIYVVGTGSGTKYNMALHYKPFNEAAQQ